MGIMTAILIGLFVFSLAFLRNTEKRLQRVNRYLVRRNRREHLRMTRIASVPDSKVPFYGESSFPNRFIDKVA